MKGVATLASLVGLASISAAGLGPIDQATETMMEYQGALLHTLGWYAAPQGPTSLSFSSYVDPQGQYFTFVLDTGQTYKGVELTFSGKGALTEPDTWSLASLANAGTGSWTTTGTAVYAGDPTGDYTIDSFIDVFFDLSMDSTTISEVTYTNTGIRTASLGKITISDVFGSRSYQGQDVYDMNTGKWTRHQGDPYPDNSPIRTSSFGESSGGGGGGRFVTYIDPVPGPAAALAPIIGFILGFWRLRRPRRSALRR